MEKAWCIKVAQAIVNRGKKEKGAGMTQDIIEMAREAGAYEDFAFNDEYFDMSRQALERFYNLAIAKEREACAKVCDELHWPWHIGDDSGPKQCAIAIRARKEQA
jgi:hypothetical protein